MGVTGIGIGELLALGARTLIVLVVLVVALRIIGKRQAGGMRSIDILVILIVASGVQSSMTKNDGHITVSLVSAGVLLLAGWLSGVALQRKPSLEQKLLGSPVVLVRNGELNERNMRFQGISEQDLAIAARKQGLADISMAQIAVLEMDGTISVVQQRQPQAN
jgi:uncharacterized membrane protein YcaP (DUF421 family)